MSEPLHDTQDASDEDLEAGIGDLRSRALSSYRRHVQDNYQRMADLRLDASRLQQFCSPVSAGQWGDDVRPIFKSLGIPEKGINETWPAVHAATGREKTDRFEPSFSGRDPEDQRFADAINATVRLDRDTGHYKHIDSKVFHQGMVQRLGAVEIYVDTWTDREPQFRARRLPVNEIMMSFWGSDINVDDRTDFSHGQWMDYREFKRTYADESDTWARLVSEAGGGSADYDSGDIWHASIGRNGSNAAYYSRRRREIFVVKHEWKERIKITQLDLPGEVAMLYQQIAGTALPMELPADPQFYTMLAQLVVQARQMQQQLQMQAQQQQVEAPPPMPMIWREVTSKQLVLFKSAWVQMTQTDYNDFYELQPETVFQAIIVGDHVLRAKETRDRNWSMFPLIPFSDDGDGVIVPYGYVDIIRPRQEWLNQFLALWIHTMAHMPKARLGVDLDKVQPGELTEINQKVARGDNVIGVRGGKDAIFDWPKGRMPDGIQEAWQMIFELVPGAAGQSRYSIGSVQDLQRTAARLVEQQVSATAATLAEAYDALSLWRSTVAKKLAGLNFVYRTPEQFASMAGRFADAIPHDKSLWMQALRMDVNVGEKVATKDMAMTALEYLNQTGMWEWVREVAPESLADLLAQIAGSNVRDEMVESLKLDEPLLLMQKLEEMLGLEPGQLNQAVEGLQQPEEGVA